MVKSIEWLGDRVRFLDQSQLPATERYVETSDYRVIAEAIRSLKLRGAPLLGVAAAYGAALAGLASGAKDPGDLRSSVDAAITELSGTRPTAVNLFVALERMRSAMQRSGASDELRSALVAEACEIHREDQEMCRMIGEHGAALIPSTAAILTHCNTGALATGGEGTAQSVILTAFRQGKSIRVFADETRPVLQGARLTAWELLRHNIDTTLITDSTGPVLMSKGMIDLVIIGADRIAANGDTANKIGSYNLAVAASYHRLPLYVAAPSSTIDRTIPSGDSIPIEQRPPTEITDLFGRRIAPNGVKVYAPAFDVVPAALISAIITEGGVHYAPFSFAP
jgi:methylthioribose-1-phosphate isomerase